MTESVTILDGALRSGIGRGFAPFVVAEMSGNHNGSLERSLAIIDAAADAGVSAVKFQTYTADTMTLPGTMDGFVITDPKSIWFGRTLHDLYAEAATPWEWHAALFERCRQRGVVPFSTPFDATAVELLESLGAPLYKVASFELNDHDLIRRIAATGKPVVMSTGMATLGEIDEAVRTARQAGAKDIVLLKCTSAYPAPPEGCNIATIPELGRVFGCQAGISDHTLGIGVSVAAVALGATFVEKHFTLRRSDGGVDSAFSMEPDEMASLVVECRRASAAVGGVSFGSSAAEKGSLMFRRSLYVVRDVPAGAALTQDDVKAIRPGYGMPPGLLGTIVGMRVRRDVARGTPLTWELLG